MTALQVKSVREKNFPRLLHFSSNPAEGSMGGVGVAANTNMYALILAEALRDNALLKWKQEAGQAQCVGTGKQTL